MSRFHLVFALTLLVATAAHADDRTWTVQPGDALSTIAERFRVTVTQLQTWNELEGDTIYVGQELRVAELVTERSERSTPGSAAEAPRAAAELTPPPPEGGEYTIQAGDTLSELALRFQISVEDLVEMNPGLAPDAIQAGQVIRVDGESNTVEYQVRRGDSLHRLATRFGTTVRDIKRRNRLRSDTLRLGQRLHIHATRPFSHSQSIGEPTNGELREGLRITRHPAYVVRNRNRSWGTLETIEWIRAGFDAVRAHHPRVPRVRVHDISNREGGRMTDHRSHQSGRDVDITYYRERCGPNGCPLAWTGANQIDVDVQWTLLRHWLQRGQLDRVFIDYALQEPLYNEARRRGATRQQLHRWFQYPRGRDYPLGIIRHFPNHRDHLHVRFVCPKNDRECRR